MLPMPLRVRDPAGEPIQVHKQPLKSVLDWLLVGEDFPARIELRMGEGFSMRIDELRIRKDRYDTVDANELEMVTVAESALEVVRDSTDDANVPKTARELHGHFAHLLEFRRDLDTRALAAPTVPAAIPVDALLNFVARLGRNLDLVARQKLREPVDAISIEHARHIGRRNSASRLLAGHGRVSVALSARGSGGSAVQRSTARSPRRPSRPLPAFITFARWGSAA